MLLQSAFEALRSRNFADAEQLSRQVLVSEPRNPHALHLLAEALAISRPADAVGVFRQIIKEMQGVLSTLSVEHGLNTLKRLGWRPAGIIDVGAYQGRWSIMALQIFPDAHALMIEPQARLEDTLKKVVASSARTSLRRALLGAEFGEVDFVQMEIPITTGSSIYPEQTSFARSTTQMEIVTLDSVLSDFPNQRFDLLKLDVQGAELDVLAGAKATLPQIEVIVIELSLLEYNKGAPLIGDVVSKLNTLDFQMFDVYPLSRHRSGALMQADAIFARRSARVLPTPPFA